MKGEWVQDPKTQAWHLVTLIDVGQINTWCRIVVDDPKGDVEIKLGSRLDGWGDALHDECVRQSETLDGA